LGEDILCGKGSIAFSRGYCRAHLAESADIEKDIKSI
jgi:hypothetical protein